MDWQQTLATLAALPPDDKAIWLRIGAGLATLVLLLLWLESRFFARSGRVGSWLAVRLSSVIAAPLVLAILVLPARSVSGMEGLAVFYLALFTAAPLLWFGSHVLAGRWVRPRLSAPESLALAVSGLLILAIPGTAFFAAQGPLQAASREIGMRREVPANNPPLAHTVQPVQTYEVPGVGRIYTQTLLGAPDTRLLRVEQRQGGQWPTDRSAAHPSYCTNGNDLHLMWSAGEAPPYMRLHWAQSNGAAAHAEFTPDMAAASSTAPAFSIGFRPDGVDPIAPIPRTRAYLVLHRPDAAPYTQMLGNPPEAGETRTSDCILPGYRIWTGSPGWQVHAMGLTFSQPSGQTLRGVITRP